MYRQPLRINIYPVRENKRIRFETTEVWNIKSLVWGLRVTEHRIDGYYEGNFNMRILQEVFRRAQKAKDEYELAVHPFIVSAFKRWNDKRLSLLKRKKKSDSEIEYFNREKLWGFQRVDVEFLVAAEQAFIANEMGTGKGQLLDALILTIDGFKKNADLKLGDLVASTDGKFYPVVGLYPRGVQPVYKVVFSDETSIECDSEHLWSVIKPQDKYKGKKFETLSTRNLIKEGIKDSSGGSRYHIPLTKPIEFPKSTLPIHPYLFGYLLGNGCFTRPGVLSFSTPNQETVDTIESILDNKLFKIDKKSKYDYNIQITYYGSNPLIDALKALKLWGKTAKHKFIPDEYKYSSVEDRILLLQGLMDADGSVSAGLEFGVSSKTLIEDFQSLVESLGGLACVKERTVYWTYADLDASAISYRCVPQFPETINPFKLSVKADKYKPKTKRKVTRAIRSIEYVDEKPTQCISVDSPDHLYITEHYIVTHNTVEACATIEVWRKKFPDQMKHGLIICPTSGLYSWRDHLIGSSTNEAWTTYDRHQVLVADNPASLDRLLPIMVAQSEPFDGVVIVNWETFRNKACAKFLTNYVWDFIIADEVHRARNLKALQSKEFLRTLGRRKLALSGTGVVNSGTDLFAIVNWLKPDQYDNIEVFTEDFVERPKRTIRRLTADGYTTQEVDAIDQELDYLMVRREKKDVLKDLPEKRIEDKVVHLNPRQRLVYNQMRDEMIVALSEQEDNVFNATVAIAQLMRLKQIAISPALLKLTQEPFKSQSKFNYQEIKGFDDSSKLDWLMDFIEETEDNEKLVTFSQYESAIKLFEARIQNSNYWKRENPYGYARYTGQSCGYVPYGEVDFKRVVDPNTGRPSPKGLQDIFQTDPTVKLWDGTLKASGELLTLTAASTVVAIDQWWNDATMQQAYDRVHRHGQTQPVRIIRLIAEDTVELDILALIESKANEFKSMIKTREFLLELLIKDQERGKGDKKVV